MGAFAKRNWTPASILIVSKPVSSYGADVHKGFGKTKFTDSRTSYSNNNPHIRQSKDLLVKW